MPRTRASSLGLRWISGLGARGLNGWQRADSRLCKLRNVLQAGAQHGAGPLGQGLLLRDPELEGIPVECHAETFLQVDADVRLAALDFADVFRAEAGELRKLGLTDAALIPLALQSRAETFTKARMRHR